MWFWGHYLPIPVMVALSQVGKTSRLQATDRHSTTLMRIHLARRVLGNVGHLLLE